MALLYLTPGREGETTQQLSFSEVHLRLAGMYIRQWNLFLMQWKLTQGKIERLRSTQARRMASEEVFTGTALRNAGKQIVGRKDSNV